MPPPTTERGLLGHFLRGTDPPTFSQSASPPPLRSPTSLSLRDILAAGAGGGGARGGTGGRKSPRDDRGEGRGAFGITRDGGGAKSRKAGGGEGDVGGDRDDGNGGKWEA